MITYAYIHIYNNMVVFNSNIMMKIEHDIVNI